MNKIIYLKKYENGFCKRTKQKRGRDEETFFLINLGVYMGTLQQFSVSAALWFGVILG
jgi:hypothetical protein